MEMKLVSYAGSTIHNGDLLRIACRSGIGVCCRVYGCRNGHDWVGQVHFSSPEGDGSQVEEIDVHCPICGEHQMAASAWSMLMPDNWESMVESPDRQRAFGGDGEWTTLQGVTKPISDLDNEHLINCVLWIDKALLNHVKKRPQDWKHTNYLLGKLAELKQACVKRNLSVFVGREPPPPVSLNHPDKPVTAPIS